MRDVRVHKGSDKGKIGIKFGFWIERYNEKKKSVSKGIK